MSSSSSMKSSRRFRSASPRSSASASSITEWSFTASPSTAIAEPRITWRAAARVGGLVLLLIAVAPIHVATKWIVGRSPWPSRFLAAAAWTLGVRGHRSGEPIAPHTLLIANHTSWLDILVLGGWANTAFVSKDELGHPLIHWLADQNSTVYGRRSNRAGAKEQAVAVAKALEDDKPVTVFPEGT